MVLSPALDQYLQQSISHSLGLPVSQEFLLEKLNQVEQSKRDLESQVYSLQRRLLELQYRLNKSREEASMNAVALKRQVAENQKLLGQCKQLSQQCAWLEDECSLYINDREVFMGAADEAEDRALKAEERAAEAEKEVGELLMEVDRLKKVMVQTNHQMGHAQVVEEIAILRCKLMQLESDKASLQNELVAVEANAKKKIDDAAQPQIEQGKTEIQAVLATSNFNFEHQSLQNSAISDDNMSSICSERQGVFEQHLMAEIQRLRQEAALYKCNLAKAEIEVQILADDNKELKLALRNKCPNSASPLSKEGKGGLSKLQSKSHSDFFGSENTLRQPLIPLQSNSPEFRLLLQHR